MIRTAYILTVLILTSCQMKNSWECNGDCYNGEGTKKWKDGGLEKGTWENGELIGQGYQFFGKTSDFAGDSYEGEFQIRYHGFGKYIYSSEGATYIGYWKNGKAEGKGKLTFAKNSDYPNRFYDGEWKNGLRHGYGEKFWGEAGKYTNNRYQGEWKEDEMDGFGRYDWPDEGTYLGQWEKGIQHGEGIYIFIYGDTLKSRWIEGYCKDLAVLKTGKDASYFKTQIEEINIPTSEKTQKFIDITVKELQKQESNSSYSIDFITLRKLLDTTLVVQRGAISKFEKINEYDEQIPYKQDNLKVQYSFMDVLNECDIWINLAVENTEEEEELIHQSIDKVFEKFEIMKNKQEKFEKTNKEFIKKYWH